MHPCRVLFLCSGNSARSILSEATLNHMGKGRFEAFSAGSHPAERVHPGAIEQLKGLGIPVEGLASKSWKRFAEASAPTLDVVITVCGNAANETCPVFVGDFTRSHWGLPDPAAADVRAPGEAFHQVHRQIIHRLNALLAIPIETMSGDELQDALDRIGTLVSDDEAAA